MADSSTSKATLTVEQANHTIYRLGRGLQEISPSRSGCPSAQDLAGEPAAHRGRHQRATSRHRGTAQWDAKADPMTEIAFTVARVCCRILPASRHVDLAAMRDA